jgi:chorismate synthase
LICWLLVAVVVAEAVVQVVVVLAVLQKPRTTPLHQARVTASRWVLAEVVLQVTR